MSLRDTRENRITFSAATEESLSRNSAGTEEREGRCLRNPCRSRPCTRDWQLGFWIVRILGNFHVILICGIKMTWKLSNILTFIL
jgi:hypothetical protein